MRERYGARLYLFGSRARGTQRPTSDFDMVAVADAFGQQPRLGRARDRFFLWHDAGGWGQPLDLHCYTPAEFREEVRGLGYLGHAKRRGELRRIVLRPRRRARTAAPTTESPTM
jgi:predicted nucleotidyltransferase